MIKAAASLTCLLSAAASAQCEGWTPIPGHPSPYHVGDLVAVASWDPDGPGGAPAQLVVGGANARLQGLPTGAVGRWDGARWHAMGEAFNGTVAALHVWNGRLYAGGDFTRSGQSSMSALARWEGDRWVPVTSAVFTRASGGAPIVRALLEYHGRLAVVGGFTRIGDLVAGSIALWDGASFTILGAGVNGYIRAAVVHQGDLVVGGDLSSIDSGPIASLARWDGAAWHPVGPAPNDQGVNGAVRALASFGDSLCIGGDFSRAGASFAARRLVALGPAGWSRMGSASALVRGMLITRDGLIVTGNFNAIDDVPRGGIALWNGADWSSALGDFSLTPHLYSYFSPAAVIPWNDGLAVVGQFASVDGISACGVAARTTGGWTPLAQGLAGGVIRCTAWLHGELYAGGSFVNDQDERLNGLARWDGRRWRAVPGWGGPSDVQSLAVEGGRLWAAGAIQPPPDEGGPTNAARFDGAGWVWASGRTPFLPRGRAVVWNHRLVLADGPELWAWDGADWSRLPSPPGLVGDAPHPAAYREQLVCWLGLSSAPADFLAFDGQAWRPLPPSGLGGVNDVMVHGDELYAAGIGSAGTVAIWNGAFWSSVSSSYLGRTLAGAGPHVYLDSSDFLGGTTRSRVAPSPPVAYLPRCSLLRGLDSARGDFFGALLVGAEPNLSFSDADGSALYVSGPPVIIGQPLPAPCSSPRLDVVALGMNLRYQWRRDGAPIDGATSAALDLARLGPAGLYDCLIANDCGEVLSSPVLYAPCPADYGCDGFADFFDYDAFLADFEAGLPAADLNADGFVDLFDYADFVASFEAGC